MSILSDYKRCVSDPLEAQLRERIATLSSDNERLRKALEEARPLLSDIEREWGPSTDAGDLVTKIDALLNPTPQENPNGR